MTGEEQAAAAAAVQAAAQAAHQQLVDQLRLEGNTLRGIKIPPPPHFDGKPENWEDWSYLFVAYTSAHCVSLGRAVQDILAGTPLDRITPGRALVDSGLDSYLYHMLISFLKNEARNNTKNLNPPQSGLVVWHKLVQNLPDVRSTQGTAKADVHHEG